MKDDIHKSIIDINPDRVIFEKKALRQFDPNIAAMFIEQILD